MAERAPQSAISQQAVAADPARAPFVRPFSIPAHLPGAMKLRAPAISNHAMQRALKSHVLQAKLTVNQPGDIYEQEADRVAEQVMRMPDPGAHTSPMFGAVPGVQRKCSCGGSCDNCKAEKSDEEPGRVQMKPSGAGVSGHAAAPSIAPPIVHEVLRSPGQPLDRATRTFFEARFGYGFDKVRVHTDNTADHSAAAVNARAYTVGHHIVFGAGQCGPSTAEGKKLMAHELTHVMQQSSPSDSFGRVMMRQPKPVETKLSGCHGNQPNQIAAVVQEAKTALNAAMAVVGNAYGRPNSLSAARRQLLMDHFHTTSHDHLRKILGTYISIGRAFDSGLKIQCEATCPKTGTEAVCGYAYNTQWFGGVGPIHICFDTAPHGCDFATTDPNHRIALVVHEAAHRHAGVDDKKYVWQPEYATLSTEDAMHNADSYAWFAVLV